MNQNNNNQNIFNNPLFQNLSPEKLQFLMNFQNMNKPHNTAQAAPFLNETINNAKQQGIQFTKDESSMLMELIMQNMPENERIKAEMILMMMKMR